MHPFIKRLFQFFLPPQCHCCETFLEEGKEGICSGCLSEIRWVEPPFCSICGTPFPSKAVENHACGDCVGGKRYFTTARALGYYEGSLRKAIHRWKYEGRVYLSPIFGRWMAEGYWRYWKTTSFDLVIPVPLHVKRLREREFNQALLLAKELSKRTGIPYGKGILRKGRQTLPQVDLSGGERERGVRGAFQTAPWEELKGKAFLLVDDVYTTGATVDECSKVLIEAGAERVDVLTLARTIKIS